MLNNLDGDVAMRQALQSAATAEVASGGNHKRRNNESIEYFSAQIADGERRLREQILLKKAKKTGSIDLEDQAREYFLFKKKKKE